MFSNRAIPLVFLSIFAFLGFAYAQTKVIPIFVTAPVLDINFATNSAFVQGTGIVAPSSIVSVSRALGETYINNEGIVSSVGNNVLATGNAGLQIWNGQTNLSLHSQDVTGWGAFSGTAALAANQTAAPDGTTTASKFTEGGTNVVYGAFNANIIYAANSVVTLSSFVKANGRRYIALINGVSATAWFAAVLDTQTGIIAVTGAGSAGTYISSTVRPITNGWFYLTVTGSVTAAAGIPQLEVGDGSALSANGALPAYLGNSSSGFFWWGVQLERLATVASPYIPTTTIAVARPDDVVTLSNTAYASSSMSMVAIFALNSIANSPTVMSIDTAKRHAYFPNALTAAFFDTAATPNAITVANSAILLAPTKVGVTVTSAGRAVVMNGGTVVTDANVPGTGTPIRIGALGATQYLNGNIRRIIVWSPALSNAELLRYTQ